MIRYLNFHPAKPNSFNLDCLSERRYLSNPPHFRIVLNAFRVSLTKTSSPNASLGIFFHRTLGFHDRLVLPLFLPLEILLPKLIVTPPYRPLSACLYTRFGLNGYGGMCSGIVLTFCRDEEVVKLRFIVGMLVVKDSPRKAVWREEVDAVINRVDKPAIVSYRQVQSD